MSLNGSIRALWRMTSFQRSLTIFICFECFICWGPRILQVDFVRALVPYRLELKGRDELLSWRGQLSSDRPNEATDQAKR